MKVKTILMITVVATVVVAVAVVTAGVVSYSRVNQATRRDKIAEGLTDAAFGRIAARSDWLLFHNERTATQWRKLQEQVGSLLLEAGREFRGTPELAEIKGLLSDQPAMSEYFRKLQENWSAGQAGALDPGTVKKVEDQLIGEMTVRAQRLVDFSTELSLESSREASAVVRSGITLPIALLAILALLVVLDTVVVSLSVLRRLAALREGTEKVAEGDLDFRIDDSGRSEVAGLARAFNEMTTRLKGSYLELESVKARLEQLMRSSPAVIYSSEPFGDYAPTFVSESIHALLGYTQEEFLSTPDFWADRIHPDDKERIFSGLSEIFEKGHHAHEYRFAHKDGTYRWMHDGMELVRDEQGNPLEIFGFMVDITERKRVEEQLEMHRDHLEELVRERTEELGRTLAELERSNAELEGFAHTIAHDLKGPLASMAVATDVIKVMGERPVTDDTFANVGEALDIMVRSVDRATIMVDGLLLLARAGQAPGEVTDVDVGRVVRSVLGEKSGVIEERRVEVTVDERLGTIRANEFQVYQVFANLIVNAIKHNDSPEPAIEVRSLPADEPGEHRYLVRDNGPGIPLEDLERVFLPFFKRGKTGETGIGLATVEKIVRVCGGAIRAYNEDGACFEFSMRDAGAAGETMIEGRGMAGIEHAAPARGQALLRILLIEDDPADVRLFREMLRKISGGPVALESEDRLASGLNRLKNESFDIIILDLMLPDSQGLDTYQKVRPFARLTPVVILTGLEDEELAEMAVKDGAQDYLVKLKINADILARSIRYALGRHSAAESLRKSEAELSRQAEELRNLLTVASHELRHPATVFKGYSYILLENADRLDSDVARDALQSIDRASDRIAGIVNELMDATLLESGELSLDIGEVDLSALLDSVASKSQTPGIRINTSDDTGEGAAFKADREKLETALAHLVENAVKFSAEGSSVDVRAETAPGGVLFSVCDRGPGIPGEHGQLVFERFYQVEDVDHHSTPGLGLGLFIARTLVEGHGGWIAHRPREGGGSTFEFFIPQPPAG